MVKTGTVPENYRKEQEMKQTIEIGLPPLRNKTKESEKPLKGCKACNLYDEEGFCCAGFEPERPSSKEMQDGCEWFERIGRK